MGIVNQSRATGRVWVPTAVGSVVTPATSGDVALSVDPTTLQLRLKDSSGNSWPLAARNKFDATTAPGTGDDDADGYAPGSVWIDVTNDKAYVCVDASTGAAVWTETTGAGGGGGIDSGTSFPGSPSTGDLFFRTDIRNGMLFVYDGTRWISHEQFAWVGGTDGASITASSTFYRGPLFPDFDTYLEAVEWMFYQDSGAWTLYVATINYDDSSTLQSSRSTSGEATTKWFTYRDSIDAVVSTDDGNSGSNVKGIYIGAIEDSAGAIYAQGTVYGRLVAT